jgi:hypothetical protein
MTRVVPRQSDLFSPAAAAAEPAPAERPPLDELADLLAVLRAADRLPWPDVTTAMAAELRAYGLARRAGDEGARLAAAIMEESERLFVAEEHAARVAATR